TLSIVRRDSRPAIRDYSDSTESAGAAKVFDGGRRVAFVAELGGQPRVCADTYPTRTGRIVLSPGPCATQPVSYDAFWVVGDELIYFAPDGVTLKSSKLAISAGRVSAGPAQTLFTLPENCRGLDISPDGRSFVMALATG